jgi:hypothetical protein
MRFGAEAGNPSKGQPLSDPMSKNRQSEARTWDDAEADGDRAIAELRESLARLRGEVRAYREQVGDNDDAGEGPAEKP